MQNLYLIMDIRFQYFLVTLALALQCIPVAAAHLTAKFKDLDSSADFKYSDLKY